MSLQDQRSIPDGSHLSEDEKQRLQLEADNFNRTRITEVVDKVNDEFHKEGIDPITKHDIKFFMQYIGNVMLGSNLILSRRLFDKYFEKPSLECYSHFTTMSSFEKMINSGKIRMYNLNKNFHQEFNDFYRHHDMDGYDKRRINDMPYCEYLMSELFVFCLSSNEDNRAANARWANFAADGRGVRLVFKLRPKVTDDFRRVFYFKRDNPIVPPIKNLNTHFLEKYNRFFLFAQASKFGAFYIRKVMWEENEYRFLVKKGTATYEFTSKIETDEALSSSLGRKITYIEEPFHNPYAIFELVAVQGGCYSDEKEIERILSKHSGTIEILKKFSEDEYNAH